MRLNKMRIIFKYYRLLCKKRCMMIRLQNFSKKIKNQLSNPNQGNKLLFQKLLVT